MFKLMLRSGRYFERGVTERQKERRNIMKAAKKHHRSTLTRTKFLTQRVRVLFVSALVLLSLTIAALYLVSPQPVEAVSTSIVISQVYGGGGNTGATYRNDFIELYNLGTTTVNLSGWSVQYASATNSNWTATPLSGSLAPGHYYLVQEGNSGGSVGTSLPTPDATGNIDLSATAGKVALVNSTTSLSSTDTCSTWKTNSVDFVGYGTTADCREGTTTADNAPSQSNNAQAILRRNGGNQDTDNNAVDFSRGTPSPRSRALSAASSIAIDAASQGCQFFSLTSGPTLSWSHTIGNGSNRALIVGVSSYTVTTLAAPRVATVTYNGTALTRIDDTLARDSVNHSQVEMFRLLEAQMPTAGTYTISVTFTPVVATSAYAVGGAVSFSGVDQTSPFNTNQTTVDSNIFARNATTNSTGNTSPSVTVASSDNEFVIDTVASVFGNGAGDAILTANPLQIERWNGGKTQGVNAACFGNSIGAGSTRPGASPSVSMAWTLSAAQTWAIGAVSIRPASTLVRLASFEATQTKSGVMLNWRTGYEVNNLGFNLYRERNGKRVQVNPSIIAGSSFLIGQGAPLTAGDSYRWFDPQGTDDSVYYLEDVDLDGTRKLNGPVMPVNSASASTSAEQKQALLLSELNSQTAVTSSPSQWQTGWPADTGEPRELLYKVDSKSGNDLASLIAANGAVKISVNQEGWYRVTQADLAAAGFNQNVDARMLQLYEGDSQIPILMNAAQAQFSPGDSFEFYGRGLDTPTTDTNTYWLVVGNGKGLRISPATRTSSSIKTSTPNTRNSSPAQNRTVPDPRQMNAPQTIRQGWLILPTVVPPAPAPSDIQPESNNTAPKEDSTPEAAATSSSAQNDSENSSAPAKKTKKKGARAKKAHLKTLSRNHATGLRPVAVDGYLYTVQLKERLIYLASLINGETENFFGQVISSSPASETLVLQNLEQNGGGNSQLEVALQGYTLASHQVQVTVNGQSVGTINFTGQEHLVADLSVPSSVLLEGGNTVTLTRAGGSTDVSLVDYVRLTYDHSYHADGNIVRFMADGNTRLDGFTNGNISVVDVSDPRRIRELNCVVESTSQGFAVTVQANGGREYIAFTDDQILRPQSIELDKPTNLKSHDNGADLVIISYGDFLGSVQPLADLRRKEGLTVSLVDVKDVYDEFSYGAHTPYAIKDFLLWTTQHWQKAPQSVLLVGDASIDPRNYLGGGITDFVPTKLIDASSLETASDDWLADFDNDGVAEMAVGRLPVRTPAEAALVVSKIIGYLPSNALQQVLVVVDRNNADDPFSFAQSGQALGALLPSGVSMNLINRADSNDDSTLHNQIINAIDQGPLLVNYIGHGSVEVWTGAPILSTSDVSALNNGNHLSVFVMMTCLNGYFPNPARDSLAEALLRTNADGAVAVWASSGMTEPQAQSLMNQELYQQVFNQSGVTLGTAIQRAKQSTDESDARRTWILFGDPTMRLR